MMFKGRCSERSLMFELMPLAILFPSRRGTLMVNLIILSLCAILLSVLLRAPLRLVETSLVSPLVPLTSRNPK